MQAETKKRGPKSKAERTAEALTVAFSALAEAQVAAEPEIAPVVVPVAAIEPAQISLTDYIKTKERDFAPLVEISHPDAPDGGFHAGVFSGIRLKRGPCSAKYSDGTTE